MVSPDAENFDYLFKYIIIGDASVGKSNLLLRFAYGEFREEYQVTIGVEFGAKNVKIRGQTYRIQIWDTTGQENYRSITRNYYKNSACALLVYDITNRESFTNIKTWVDECKNQTAKTIFFVLVGNKSDLGDQREVTEEEGKELAVQLGIPFYESSAKTGENVEQIFNNSADEIAKKIDQNYYELDSEDCGIKVGKNKRNKEAQKKEEVKLDDKTQKKRKCCNSK